MGTVRYTVIDGEVIAEKRNGVRKLYVPDPLGSTVALLDNTQAQTDTFSYWPYGEDAGRTGTTPTPFQFVGTLGYYRDSSTRDYVRARHLNVQYGQWITEDPLGKEGSPNLYGYVGNQPVIKTDYQGTDYDWNPPFLDPTSPCGKANNIAKETDRCLRLYASKHPDCNRRLGGQLLKIMRCIIGTENRYPSNVACDPWQPDKPGTSNQGVGPCRINLKEHGELPGKPGSNACDNVRGGFIVLCEECFKKGTGITDLKKNCQGTFNVLGEVPEKGRGNMNPFQECMKNSTYK